MVRNHRTTAEGDRPGRNLLGRNALRLASVSAAVALLGTALAGTSTAALDLPAADATSTASNAADAVLQAQVKAYRTTFPGITDAAAVSAATGQMARKDVVAVALADADTYGGAWFDAPSGVLHVAVTEANAATTVAGAARAHAVRVQIHLVDRSFAELEALAAELRRSSTPLGRAAAGQVGIAVETNEVVVAVPAAQLSTLAAARPAGVSVVADPQVADFEDAGCTSRLACDWTIRSGVGIWRGGAGSVVCSAGFTARNSFARYTYTAGHCSNGNGVQWGTGNEAIGPMHASKDSGAIDASIIRVTNGWFTGDSGGQMYYEDDDHSVDVDYEAPTLGYMVPGETVCLSANITEPNGPNYCGTLATTSDAFKRGLARVDGLDGCHGDSGGGWYWLSSATYRVAYGLHSRSSFDGCHVAGGKSWFSALPVIKSSWVPSLSVETR